jgi:putative alpha-1,2-mannosidase
MIKAKVTKVRKNSITINRMSILTPYLNQKIQKNQRTRPLVYSLKQAYEVSCRA